MAVRVEELAGAVGPGNSRHGVIGAQRAPAGGQLSIWDALSAVAARYRADDRGAALAPDGTGPDPAAGADLDELSHEDCLDDERGPAGPGHRGAVLSVG